MGELYWGKVTIGNVNPTMPTPVMAEVELPRNTKFALVNGDPNMKITRILQGELDHGPLGHHCLRRDGEEADAQPERQSATGRQVQAVVTTGATDMAGNPLDQSPTTADNRQKSWTFTVRN